MTPDWLKTAPAAKIRSGDPSVEIRAASGSLRCQGGPQSKIRHLRWQCGQTLKLTQPYDGSAFIWPQMTTPAKPQAKKPCDASLMKSTMSKKFVTRQGCRTR